MDYKPVCVKISSGEEVFGLFDMDEVKERGVILKYPFGVTYMEDMQVQLTPFVLFTDTHDVAISAAHVVSVVPLNAESVTKLAELSIRLLQNEATDLIVDETNSISDEFLGDRLENIVDYYVAKIAQVCQACDMELPEYDTMYNAFVQYATETIPMYTEVPQ